MRGVNCCKCCSALPARFFGELRDETPNVSGVVISDWWSDIQMLLCHSAILTEVDILENTVFITNTRTIMYSKSLYNEVTFLETVATEASKHEIYAAALSRVSR